MSVVEVQTERGILTATLSDVDNRNALGLDILSELHGVVERANAEPSIRAVVVTNVGNTFCAGANLKERAGARAPSASERKPVAFDAVLRAIQTSPTPIIGKINGHVMGGGNGLVATLDISIAKDDAKFGFTEVRLGVVPAIISVVCLPKMRQAEAMEAFLRGHRFPATRAAELGLINRAVPEAELDAAVEEVLEDLRKAGPNALGIAKRLVHEVPLMTQKDAFEWTSKLSGELFKSDEAKEGMTAFLQRRPAEWTK